MLLLRKKWFISLFAAVTLVTTISPLTAMANPVPAPIVDTYPSSQSQDRVIEPQWKTKVAKEALKLFRDKVTSREAVNSVKKAIELLPNGKKYSGMYEDAVYGIRSNLDELLKWEEVAMNNVKDKVAGAIYDAGIPLSWSRRIADVVIEILL